MQIDIDAPTREQAGNHALIVVDLDGNLPSQ